MAEALSSLYIRLGLSLSELETDFAAADRTVSQNIARLNREQNLIRLRTEVEIGNLDAATDAVQILTARQNGLNQQIAIQRDRIRIAEANWRDLNQRHGESAAITQRAALALERERLQLQQYERELREVEESQNNVNNSQESLMDRIGSLAEKFAALGVAVEVFNQIADEVARLNERFQEMEKNAYNFNLPFDKAKEFATQIKLAGGELDDIGGYLRGITDALVKGEVDDPEWIALSKYDAQIFDATGRLKNYADIWDEVAAAYEKAKAAGEGIEFLQLTGGESGITDAIQTLERWQEAKEDAAKIVQSGFNTDDLHKAERAVNMLSLQFDELHDAIADLITPAAADTANSLFEVFREGTRFIRDNKEEIRDWGATLAEISSYLPSQSAPTTLFKSLKNLFGGADETAKDALNSAVDSVGTINLGIDDNGIDKNPLSQYGVQRTNQFRDELEDLRIELDYLDDYQRKLAEINLWRKREMEGKLFLSDDERIAIEELYSAKLEKIEQERADKVNEIRESVAAKRRTDLENALAEIEDKKEKWINAGMEEAEATQLAEQQKAEAIEQLESEWAEHINSIYQTSLENRLAQIEKEKQAWIQKGVDEVKATQAAEEQKAQIQRDAAMSVLKSQIKEYRAFQQGGYEGLRDYQLKQLYKSGIRPEDLYMTPQQLATFQKAQQVAQNSLLPNFMTANDRANQQAFLNAQRDAEEKRYQEKLANMRQKVLINGEVPEYLSEPMWRSFVNNSNLNGVSNNLDLSVAMSNMDTGIKDLTSNITTVADSFSQLPDSLSELPPTISDVTESLQDFSIAINEMELPKNLSAERQPVNVNLTVQINEAHAWDSEHIQQLADKVADQIEPAIVSAIGGDSNSY